MSDVAYARSEAPCFNEDGQAYDTPSPTLEQVQSWIPGKTTVRHTGTARGRGVFALAFFPKGSVVEVSPLIDIWATHPDDSWGALDDYMFSADIHDPKRGYLYHVALGFGSLFNHEQDANVVYLLDSDFSRMVFFARKDILPGQELTICYSAGREGFVDPREDMWMLSRNIDAGALKDL